MQDSQPTLPVTCRNMTANTKLHAHRSLCDVSMEEKRLNCDWERLKKKSTNEVMLNSLLKLFFYLSQIRQNTHTKKTGLVQHANHQDLEFKHEQAELSFPHQLSPQNDSEQNEK